MRKLSVLNLEFTRKCSGKRSQLYRITYWNISSHTSRSILERSLYCSYRTSSSKYDNVLCGQIHTFSVAIRILRERNADNWDVDFFTARVWNRAKRLFTVAASNSFIIWVWIVQNYWYWTVMAVGFFEVSLVRNQTISIVNGQTSGMLDDN